MLKLDEGRQHGLYRGNPISALRRPVMISTPPMSRSMPALLGLKSMKASRMRTVDVVSPVSAADCSCTDIDTCEPPLVSWYGMCWPMSEGFEVYKGLQDPHCGPCQPVSADCSCRAIHSQEVRLRFSGVGLLFLFLGCYAACFGLCLKCLKGLKSTKASRMRTVQFVSPVSAAGCSCTTIDSHEPPLMLGCIEIMVWHLIAYV